MRKWMVTHAPELVPHTITASRYKQLLAELAAVLYNDLSERQLATSVPKEPVVLAHLPQSDLEQRTGTHG